MSDTDKPLVIIRIGQSNATTAGTKSMVKPVAPDNMFIVDGDVKTKNFSLDVYQTGINSDPNKILASEDFSTEVLFAQKFRAENPGQPIFVVKEAVAGNGIDKVFTNGNWNPDGGSRYSALIARLVFIKQELAKQGITDYNQVILFNQGESDALRIESAQRYDDNLYNLISSLRGATHNGELLIKEDTMWIQERIRPELPDKSAPGYAGAALVRQGIYDALARDTADGHRNAVVDLDFHKASWNQIHPAAYGNWLQGVADRTYAAWKGTYLAQGYVDTNDAIPDAFEFTDLAHQAQGAFVVSNTIKTTGLEKATTIAIEGAEYRLWWPKGVNSTTLITERVLASDWTSAPGELHPYMEVEIRVRTGTGTSSTSKVVLTTGGVVTDWYVSTGAIDYNADGGDTGGGDTGGGGGIGGEGDTGGGDTGGGDTGGGDTGGGDTGGGDTGGGDTGGGDTGGGDTGGGDPGFLYPVGSSTALELIDYFNYENLPPLYGSTNDDTGMRGTAAAEHIYGFAGADTINASGGNDVVEGGDGNDYLLGDAGDDLLIGEAGNDKIKGGDGNDIMYGGAGDDLLYADTGHDIVNGGAGNDRLYGGGSTGSLFLFDSSALGGVDKVFDFYLAGNDVLDFSRLAEGDPTFALSFGTGIYVDMLRVVSHGQTYDLIQFLRTDVLNTDVQSLIDSGHFVV